MMSHKLIYGLISVVLLLLISCESSEKITSSSPSKEQIIRTNLPPTDALIESITDTVCMSGTVSLTCKTEDPENDPFTFEWASFKVTENSTVENYEFDYWRNRGRFISTGKEAYLETCKSRRKISYPLRCQRQSWIRTYC